MRTIKHKLPETHEEWLQDRMKGIGGSDAGVILGVNPWKPPYAIWAEKTGLADLSIKDNEPMRQGRDLEDYVAAFAKKKANRCAAPDIPISIRITPGCGPTLTVCSLANRLDWSARQPVQLQQKI